MKIKIKKEDTSKNSSLISEITGIVLIAISLIIFFSLISYNPDDPSWETSFSKNEKTKNFIGIFGAYLSSLFFQIFGIASFFFPFAIFYAGILVFVEKSYKLLKKSISFSIFVVSICSLLYMTQRELNWWGKPIHSGGFLGNFISEIFVDWLNYTGAIILFSSLALISIILLTKFSFRTFLSILLNILYFPLKYIYQFFKFFFSKLKRKKKRIEKKEKISEELSNFLKEKIAPNKIKKVKEEIPEESLLFPSIKEQEYTFPPLSLLDAPVHAEEINQKELKEKKKIIEEKLKEFYIEGSVLEMHPGPVITTYEYTPDAGIKISQIFSRTEDLSLALKAESILIERIPGKSAIGIEVPNDKREKIFLREIIGSEEFQKSPSKLSIALGKMVRGEIFITDLSVMPHLLIAGATGSGKSMTLNCIITSILYKASPDEVKFVLIDPKRLEFGIYNEIPHLLAPSVTEPKQAINVLKWTIKEMNERNKKLASLHARNIEQYNLKVEQLLAEKNDNSDTYDSIKTLPYIVIIVDELADLMTGKESLEVENAITSLSQMARAVGIHLILSTQRPSTDIITGTIKNNLPSRVALRVPSKIDSRVIIDSMGAEKLLGNGDMLFMPPTSSRLIRIHGAYISEAETFRLVNFLKSQKKPKYDTSILKEHKKDELQVDESLREKDELYYEALELIIKHRIASASFLQRKLRLGFARAARIIDIMEEEGIVGPGEGSKPREVLVDYNYLLKIKKEREQW
ncbi:MAG: DNA translocase FtsK [Acidobacteriota bacterium]